MFKTLDRLEVGWSITTPLYNNVRQAISAIDEDTWTPIDYPRGGLAQIAETTIWATHRKRRTERLKLRLVIRRTASQVPKAGYGPTGATTRSSPTWSSQPPKQTNTTTPTPTAATR